MPPLHVYAEKGAVSRLWNRDARAVGEFFKTSIEVVSGTLGRQSQLVQKIE